MFSELVSSAALALSGFATWKTYRFNERQKTLIALQEKLNSLLIARGQSEILNEKKADLGASFVKYGSSNYRLKIFNKGKGAARNLRIDFPDGTDTFSSSDIDGKFPLEVLEPHQSVELIASIHLGSKQKHIIRVAWGDDASDQNEKTVYPTL